MTTVPLYTYKLLNSQNQLEIGLLNHLAQQVRMTFSERDMSSSVRLSIVCLSSVTFVRPTQTIEIFGNVSMPYGTLAIHDLSVKILRRSSQGNPSVGGVKHEG